jgi:phosphodiesterase/alkaline phosphatase D-like protein
MRTANHRLVVALGVLAGALVFSVTPAVAAPEAPVTEAATAQTATSAVLHGELNPHTEATTGYEFTYNSNGTCEGTTTEPGADARVNAIKVHTLIKGLEPSREYTFCAVAIHHEGETLETTAGLPLSFKTIGVNPSVDSEGVSGVNSTGAMLEAQVNPNNQATSYSFEYATEASGEVLKGSIKALPGVGPLPAEFGDRTASVSTGAALTPGTTYFYRVITENATPPASTGQVQSFTTPPTPHTDAATGVTATIATFHGHFTLDSVDSQYLFEYGLGGCVGASSETLDAGTGSGAANEVTTVSGLEPHAEYSVCFVTKNAFGSQVGAPATFQTPGAPPTFESESNSSLTHTEATLEAQVNPNNQATTCKFDYGTSPALGTNVPCEPATLEGFPGQHASAHLAGLTPNTVYYYRVIAENGSGEAEGVPIQELTTLPPLPTVLTGGPSSVTASSATIEGTVNPGSSGGPLSNARYFFEYTSQLLPENFFGCSGVCTMAPSYPGGDAGQGTNDVRETANLTGLRPLETYHYRIDAYNGNGIFSIVYGTERQLTTLPIAPGVTTEVPVIVGTSTATVGGEIVAQGADTTYDIEYGTSEAFGANTPVADVGSGTTAEYVTTALEGLQPATTYYYRIVASNSGGEEIGKSVTFTTNAVGEPDSGALPPAFSLTGTEVAGPGAITFPNLSGFAPTPPRPPKTTVIPKALTKAQKLAKAVKACKKDKAKSKRTACEKEIRTKYGAAKKNGKKK